jgi:hypothetical protein
MKRSMNDRGRDHLSEMVYSYRHAAAVFQSPIRPFLMPKRHVAYRFLLLYATIDSSKMEALLIEDVAAARNP